jgi:Domain of unknown function (DUF4291)
MAYRSGWATKPGQERVLAIQISRTGFEWALSNSCLSHFEPATDTTNEKWQTRLTQSPVRIQWDPERDLYHSPLQHRSLQIGLTGVAVDLYVDEWVQSIEDRTGHCHQIQTLLQTGNERKALELLPKEHPYPLPTNVAKKIRLS